MASPPARSVLGAIIVACDAMSGLAAKSASAPLATRNRLRPEDRAVHDWYRFVLSFPPHLVGDYVGRFGLGDAHTVLDPFCGTGTTLVECKKLGVPSIGLEANPMAHFASSVKVDWSANGAALANDGEEVAQAVERALRQQGLPHWGDLPLFATHQRRPVGLRTLPSEQAKLLLKDSISALPLHKTMTLLDEIQAQGRPHLLRHGRLALAKALVTKIGNLKFGPEVGVGAVKTDAPVVSAWRQALNDISRDLILLKHHAQVAARVLQADARQADRALPPKSIDAVITSPPYPNEKDYSRTTRLESVILGFVRNRDELRALKQGLVRSNTRGVYKADTDDREMTDNAQVQALASDIERRRIELGKTSGFERLYSRVAQLYFGGMARHLASLRPALKPGAKLAYVVGDQASYLRILIRTGQLLANLAEQLHYRVLGIDLFRTRLATATGQQLREEVLLLEWPGRKGGGP